MTTPSTQNATKSIRVTADVHARLQKIVDTTGCQTHSDAVAFLLDPNTVRVHVTPEQRARWAGFAKSNGMTLVDFVRARVEGAIFYGADPGALRRIHDMVYALTKAAGIMPQQSTPNADHQVISGRPEQRTP
jgi:hypothetical protein